MPEPNWMPVGDVPWLQRNSPAAPLIRLADRILKASCLADVMPDLAAEFGVANCLLTVRDPAWKVVASRGEWEGALPSQLLATALDRDSAVWWEDSANGPTIIAPTPSAKQHVLMLSGTRLIS